MSYSKKFRTSLRKGYARGGAVEEEDRAPRGEDPVRVAGEVRSLPINPGPQAGQPPGREIVEGQGRDMPRLAPGNADAVDRVLNIVKQSYGARKPRGFNKGGLVKK